MLLKEQLGLDMPKSPTMGEMIPGDLYDPESKNQILNEYPREQFKDPRQPTRVEFADASGKVPLPARNNDKAPEAALSQNPDSSASPNAPADEPVFKHVKPDDSRYQDSGNILIADSVLQGALPWLQAATDVALGRVPAEEFDTARIEHEKRIEALKAEDPQLVNRIQQAVPFLSALGLSIAKPAQTVIGGAMRGATVAGAQGAVQGFTEGPPEEPSLSSNRMAQAVGGAAQTAVLGGVAGALPPGVTKGSSAYNNMRQQQAAAQRRQAAQQRSAATREQKKLAAQRRLKQERLAEEEELRLEGLRERFKSYRQAPTDPSPTWKDNRQKFFASPEEIFQQQAAREPSLEAMSRMLNLPPSAIAQRLYGRTLSQATPGEQRLFQQLKDVDDAWQATVRKKGVPMDEPDADTYKAPEMNNGTAAGTQSQPEQPPVGDPKAAANSASGAGSAKPARKRPSRAKPKPDPRPRRAGDEPIRSPSKPNRFDRN